MPPTPDPAVQNPDHELEQLLEGNRRWARSRLADDPQAFQELARVHAPPFLLVGCCDARKPVGLMTGAEPGQLFLHRNVANQVRLDDPAIGASFEFALGVLRVRHLVICGHTRCGGVHASLGPAPGGDLERWIEPVRALAAEHRADLEAIDDAHARADALAEMNVIRQAENALEHPTVQARLVDADRPLRIHGWMFRLETGLIETVSLPWERWREEGRLP
jgi:carbonic anhydrase